MTKNELIETLAQKSNTPIHLTREILNGALDLIAEELRDTGSISLYGFGTFKVRKRKSRSAFNPFTGKKTQVKASRTVGFRCGKSLKESVGN